MARTKFKVEVLTPEGEVFADDVEMLSTKTIVGSIGILAGHEPVLAILEPTELRLYRSENDTLRFAQAEGYVQFSQDHALILVEEAIEPRELDPAKLHERLEHARGQLQKAAAESEELARAQRDIRRLEAFLQVHENG